MKINRRLIFIQSTYGDAHQMARFREIKNHYSEFELLAFDRDYYKSSDQYTYKSLGYIKHGEYLNRFLSYLKCVNIISKSKSQNLMNDVYFYGFDLLPILSFFNFFLRSRLIFEIPDIREVYFKSNFQSKILKKILKFSLKKISVLVVTSDLFVKLYLKPKKIFEGNYFLMENKVHLEREQRVLKSFESNDRIVIGYFGLLRCNQSLKILLRLVEKSNRFKVIIHGYFLNVSSELITACKNNSMIKINGEYKSPQDLPKIYKNIDLSWTAYPFSEEEEGNYKLARTNRFYEAGFFGKPMIASEGSGDSINIEKHSLGVNINLNSIEDSVKKIESVKIDNIKEWKKI